MEKKYPTWEVLGVVIGFVGSANLVPDLINLFFGFYPEPENLGRWFKIYCVSGYLALIIVLSFRHLINLRGRQDENSDGIRVTTTGGGGYLSALNENNFVSFIRDFPISLFRSLISKLYKIVVFDIFNRHPEWETRSDLFKQILRSYFGDKTVEIQFKKNFEKLEVRETAGEDHNFGMSREVSWCGLEYPFLTLTTWLGCAWTLCHFSVVSKMYFRFRLVVSVLYFVGFALHVADIFDLRLSFSMMDLNWKFWIIYLLVFDLLIAVGLFLKKLWGEVSLIIVSVSQLVVYTKFSEIFPGQVFLIRLNVAVLFVYVFLRTIEILRLRISR